MRTYEKVLLVPIVALVIALVMVLADPFHITSDTQSDAGDESARQEQSVQHALSKDTSRPAQDAAQDASAARSEKTRSTRGIPAGAGRYPLCQPADKLKRLVDSDNRVALSVDPAGHLALYGDAKPETGAATDQSYDFLTGCLPQLTYVNYASVLVEGHGPVQAGAGSVSEETTKGDDGSLKTVFTFEDGVRLEQRLHLKQDTVEAAYKISNDSREPKNVSLRTLVTPPPVKEQGAEVDHPLFLIPDDDGGRAVNSEREIDGERLSTVVVPRKDAPTGSSGRLSFEGRRPDLYGFAGTLRLTATEWRRAPQVDEPLPPASSVAAYWLYEDLGPGDSAEFGYQYEPAPQADDPGSE
ncbi:MAG: hypothetical protein ACFB50_15745 [Rubrobacteraceae bacterium]